MRALRWLGVAVVVAACGAAVADVKLPAVISDNMVLQKGTKVPVFGWADAGEKVTVKAGAASAEATPGADGRWIANLDTTGIAAGAFEVTIAGKNTLTIKNVLVGEVWVASGQSNMEWVVRGSMNAQDEAASAKWPSIRMFTVRKKIATEPQKDCEGKWEVCAPETVGNFSAVGYFFARELHQKLNVPVGVIHTSWGGTPAESWASKATMADPDYAAIHDRIEQSAKNYPKAKEAYDAAMKKWVADGKPQGKQPRGPQAPGNSPHAPSSLYNGMIAPVIPYGIKGAIRYQGESNAGRSYQYRKLFPAMIVDWRKNWNQGDFSFYFVQLANFMGKDKQPGESGWAELREAQSMTLALPNTGQAVIIDIGDEKDIHPKNKQDVGKRLAQWALAKDYGKTEVVYSGPMYKSMKVEGDAVRISFDHIGGGLVTKPRADCPASAEKLTGFAIAGEDKKFAWAEAKIEGDTVVVRCPAVAKPVAVRYGWSNNPDVNLYNKADLPASPFRTDTWPGVTADKK